MRFVLTFNCFLEFPFLRGQRIYRFLSYPHNPVAGYYF